MSRRCESDPGARSALRSGVGKDLDAVPRMHQVIAHLVPPAADDRAQRAYYAVAAMIAEQTRRKQRSSSEEETEDAEGTEEAEDAEGAEDGASGGAPAGTAPGSEDRAATLRPDYGSSLGAAFAAAVDVASGRERQMRRGTAESRLNVLCKQQITGLHRHLPASVRYLRSLGVPVDFARLLQDLLDWPRDSGRITRYWLQDFYRELQKADRRRADSEDAEAVVEDATATVGDVTATAESPEPSPGG
ncbi:type I-E CRISPR-associated protein Cse2/CasB [Streptomyces sp. LD120]|uniref:Type I-E CRISPR-associated protein Cse2/CasB n=1 Tax=Streptomyces physcomitrii TaxID=2724184 RepID=A0ABX1GYD2_9ACTN|nr:type I-E CRISPR-associated protein Cse2/CasB [Streptomyces physcomitrii]